MAPHGTLTFEPGVTTQAVRVALLNCDESLGGFPDVQPQSGSNSSDSTIVRASTQIDITGDDRVHVHPQACTSCDAVIDNSAGTIDVPVLLGGPSGTAPAWPVTVHYSTNNGTAIRRHRLHPDHRDPHLPSRATPPKTSSCPSSTAPAKAPPEASP